MTRNISLYIEGKSRRTLPAGINGNSKCEKVLGICGLLLASVLTLSAPVKMHPFGIPVDTGFQNEDYLRYPENMKKSVIMQNMTTDFSVYSPLASGTISLSALLFQQKYQKHGNDREQHDQYSDKEPYGHAQLLGGAEASGGTRVVMLFFLGSGIGGCVRYRGAF